MYDLVVIGAGPVGLACAIDAQRQGLTVRVLEKGALVNSILGYPARMEFFSTPELIEVGGHPFPIPHYKPTREDALEYYRLVAARESLDVRLYERVVDVRGAHGDFTVVTDKGEHACRHVVLAIGFFDHPNRLDVPGEDLPKVTHYYRNRSRTRARRSSSSAPRTRRPRRRSTAIGTAPRSRWSCVGGAVRQHQVLDQARPREPDQGRQHPAFFGTSVREIREGTIVLQNADGLHEIANDWVLAMTGYHPDFGFLERLGIALADDRNRTPIYDERDVRDQPSGRVHRGHGVRRLLTPAAGSSRTDASTRGRSSRTSPHVPRRPCRRRGCAGRRKSDAPGIAVESGRSEDPVHAIPIGRPRHPRHPWLDRGRRPGAPPPATSGYLLPPKAIVDILDAPPPPTVELSPSRDVVALLDRASMPTIAQLSQPMHRIAGIRVNPRTNGPHRAQLSRAITLKSIADGREMRVTTPPIRHAVLDRVLARRQALRLHAAARHRHRTVGR
jgi:thioredoxin reductase (NADPH)